MYEVVLTIIVLVVFAGAVYVVERFTKPKEAGGQPPVEQPTSLLALLLKNRPARFLIMLGVVLAISAAALYAAVWAMVHPTHPLSRAYVIGIIALVVIGRIFRWHKAIRSLFK